MAVLSSIGCTHACTHSHIHTYRYPSNTCKYNIQQDDRSHTATNTTDTLAIDTTQYPGFREGDGTLGRWRPPARARHGAVFDGDVVAVVDTDAGRARVVHWVQQARLVCMHACVCERVLVGAMLIFCPPHLQHQHASDSHACVHAYSIVATMFTLKATQPSSCQWHTPRTVTVAHCDVMVRTPSGDATVAEKTARILASCQAVGVSFFVLDLGRLRAPTPHMQVPSLTLCSFLFAYTHMTSCCMQKLETEPTGPSISIPSMRM